MADGLWTKSPLDRSLRRLQPIAAPISGCSDFSFIAFFFFAPPNFLLDIFPSVRARLPLVDAYLQAGLDALGDSTRMAIFHRLSAGPIAVNELARTLPVSRPAVSQHLRVLKDAGLVTDSRAGTRRLYQLNPEGVARLRAHFDRVWDTAMKSFEASVEKIPSGESHVNNRRRSRRS